MNHQTIAFQGVFNIPYAFEYFRGSFGNTTVSPHTIEVDFDVRTRNEYVYDKRVYVIIDVLIV